MGRCAAGQDPAPAKSERRLDPAGQVPGLLLRVDAGPPFGLTLFRSLGGYLDHFIQQVAEILEARGWDNDRVAPPADILGNSEKTAARIFLQSEDERFPLDLNFLRLNGVLDHLWFWHATVMVRAVPERRWSLVRNHTNSLPGVGCATRQGPDSLENRIMAGNGFVNL